jgi:hypothetical protein
MITLEIGFQAQYGILLILQGDCAPNIMSSIACL